tara:strand:- start:4091 stop:4465 length:375 start_codon:yes stop_codon:yes gene_type:complete
MRPADVYGTESADETLLHSVLQKYPVMWNQNGLQVSINLIPSFVDFHIIGQRRVHQALETCLHIGLIQHKTIQTVNMSFVDGYTRSHFQEYTGNFIPKVVQVSKINISNTQSEMNILGRLLHAK